jgi:hypothetical protein
VKPISQFGKKLLATKSGSVRLISHLSSPKIETFSKLSRYILINFHLEFGGFDRLKTCDYCGKLVLKKDKRKFCSDPCKSKFFNATEKEERRLCRERQKAWFRNYMKDIKDVPYPVFKSECANCNDFVKSGGCPIMLKNNKEQLEKARKMREIKPRAHI